MSGGKTSHSVVAGLSEKKIAGKKKCWRKKLASVSEKKFFYPIEWIRDGVSVDQKKPTG